MKNHVKVNGKLLQTNKKWSHLKQKQKEWIANLLRERYLHVTKEKGTKPSTSDCEEILSEVLRLIKERGMWIPDYEVEKYFNGKKTKWQRQFDKQKGTELNEK